MKPPLLSLVFLILAVLGLTTQAMANTVTGILIVEPRNYAVPADLDKITDQDCYYRNIRSPGAMRDCRVARQYCQEDYKQGRKTCELLRAKIDTGYGTEYLVTNFIRKDQFSPSLLAKILNSEVGPILSLDFVTIEFSGYLKENFEYLTTITLPHLTKMHDAFPAVSCVSPVLESGKFYYAYHNGYNKRRLEYDRKFERSLRIDSCMGHNNLPSNRCSNFWAAINTTPFQGAFTGPSSHIDELSVRADYFKKYGEENYDYSAQNSNSVSLEVDGQPKWEELPYLGPGVNEIELAKTPLKPNATLVWSSTRTGKTSKQDVNGGARLFCYRTHKR